MRRLIAVLALAPALAWAQGDFCDPQRCAAGDVTYCCDELIVAMGEASAFSQGCYEGNGQDNRRIPTGLTANVGLVMVFKVTDVVGENSTYRIAQLVGDSSCGMVLEAPQCEANGIQAVGVDYFEVGTADEVNGDSNTYCWFAFESGATHGTFEYTGDGSSPRTITTPFAPSWVGVQIDSTAAAFGKGHFYFRSEDMPATESFGWYNVSEGARTQVVRSLTSAGFTVGSDANENGKVYRGWWWADGDGYGEAGTFTGNGDSGGGCSDAGDFQVITPGPAPVNFVFVSGCMTDLCGGGTCVTHSGTAPVVRGINMGDTVVGPGNTANNFISLWAYGAFGDVLGDLDANSFTVAGTGGVGALTLNDTGQVHYAFAIEAPNAADSIGTVSLVDWCDQSMVGCYEFENALDLGEMNKGAGTIACSAANCDLENVAPGAVSQDTINKVIGSGAGDFVAASLDYLRCTACTEYNLGGSGSLSWGYFGRAVSDAFFRGITKATSTTIHYSLYRDSTNDLGVCHVREAGGTERFNQTANGAFTINAFHALACRFDNPGNTLQITFDGIESATTAVTDNLATNASVKFLLGANAAENAFWNGQLDDVWVYNGLLSDAALCRIQSCSITGGACSCWAVDPTMYVDTGFNATLGGGCDLTAIDCDAVTP